MSIGFDKPSVLIAGFAALGLVLAASRRFKSFLSLEVPLGPLGGAAFRPPVNLAALIRVLSVLEILGAALLITAAAGPHQVLTRTVWLNRGADIIFILDISPSMAAMDMNGRSRFEEARALIRDFAARRPSDAIGLAAAGSEAALLTPMTTDRRVLNQRLDALEIGELGDGTALGVGIALAAEHLAAGAGVEGPGRGAPRRAAVLVTDGENNAGAINPETAAALLPGVGASFWVIGVGSGGEVPFSYIDPKTRARRTGSFNSRYDPEALQALARRGKGEWVPAASAAAFAAAFARLDQAEMTIRRSAPVKRQAPFHNILIITAMGFLCFARFTRRVILGAAL